MCNFSFSPDLWPKKVHMFDESWECPYPDLPGQNYCVFHIHPILRERMFDTQTKRDLEYIKAVRSVGVLHIICTTVRNINLKLLSRFTYRNDQIQIGYSTITNKIDLSNDILDGYLALEDCWINELNLERGSLSSGLRVQRSKVSTLRLSETTIQGQSTFVDTVISDGYFIDTKFENRVSFCERIPDPTPLSEVGQILGKSSCKFTDEALFMGTKFNQGAIFAGVKFDSGANFNHAEFNSGCSFEDAEFNIGCHFGFAEFNEETGFVNADLGTANFEKVEFHGPVVFDGANFGSGRTYTKDTHILQHGASEGIPQRDIQSNKNVLDDFVFADGVVKVGRKAASFDNVTAKDLMSIEDASADDMITAFNSNFYFLDIDIEFESSSPTISFYGSEIKGGTVTVSNENSFIEFAGATVGNLSITSTIDKNPFENIFIEDTSFDGFDFTRYRDEMRDLNWRIDGYFYKGEHRPCDNRESTFAKAKSGAQQIGDYYSESKFFVREQRHRRDMHKEGVIQAGNLAESVKHARSFSSNLFYDILCMYAESSKRVVSWSILSTLLFAGFYRFFNVDLPYSISISIPFVVSSSDYYPFPVSEISGIEYLVFSIESFSAFLLSGGPSITNPTIRLISSIQAFTGTFLIALFVVTFVRTVKR